jgi:uncharacterized hydrophobic protein (TIGR00271 family)
MSPPDLTGDVLHRLEDDHAVVDLVVLRGVCAGIAADLVEADLAREGANGVVADLRALGVDRSGSITLQQIEVAVGTAAEQAEERAPGYGTDAAVWETVEARAREESALTPSFLVFVVLAALIAAVGLVEDSPILIVGAMVVGPEFGPIAGLSLGLSMRRFDPVRTAATTLAVGFVVGAAATLVGTWLADATGLVPRGFSPHAQPLTGFIVEPSVLSFVVALLAGVAGTLSLTQAKAGALIGVLISVTTIPAVAAIGVSAALGDLGDVVGATLQLLLNIVALVIAGVLTLVVQRAAWDRVARRGGSRRGLLPSSRTDGW